MRSRRLAVSTSKHSGALMSSRLIAPKVGSMRCNDLDQLGGIGFVQFDVEGVNAGELS